MLVLCLYIKKHVINSSLFEITNCRTTRNIPEFKVQPELALELLMAANFLDT